MRDLAYNCRLLKKEARIEDTWSFNGILKIKKLCGEIVIIEHEVDLYELFPDFKDFLFDINFCKSVACDEADIVAYDDLYTW